MFDFLLLFSTEQNLARVELHKESLEREAEELAQIKEDLTVELAAVQKEKEIQVIKNWLPKTNFDRKIKCQSYESGKLDF